MHVGRIAVVILSNGGVYCGDEAGVGGTGPGPTALSARAYHELMVVAFGGNGHHITTQSARLQRSGHRRL